MKKILVFIISIVTCGSHLSLAQTSFIILDYKEKDNIKIGYYWNNTVVSNLLEEISRVQNDINKHNQSTNTNYFINSSMDAKLCDYQQLNRVYGKIKEIEREQEQFKHHIAEEFIGKNVLGVCPEYVLNKLLDESSYFPFEKTIRNMNSKEIDLTIIKYKKAVEKYENLIIKFIEEKKVPLITSGIFDGCSNWQEVNFKLKEDKTSLFREAKKTQKLEKNKDHPSLYIMKSLYALRGKSIIANLSEIKESLQKWAHYKMQLAKLYSMQQ